MNKLFTVAGTSVKNGVTKVRWANDVKRHKMLERDGQTDIVLIELPVPMNKLHATQFIGNLDEFQSVAQQTAIAEFIAANDDGTVLVLESVESEPDVETDDVETDEVATEVETGEVDLEVETDEVDDYEVA